jgi:hypothetical protein
MATILTCWAAFKIPSAVKCSDGTYAPFTIASTISYDGLHILIAEKLRCFPGLMKLQYRLDSDKAKTGATSIRSDEELSIFKERMRRLIVPQRLPSGKISTRPLREVRVCFEDAGEQAAGKDISAGKTAGKKVCLT